MWISKDEYEYLEDQLKEARHKAKEFDSMVAQAEAFNEQGAAVVLDGKCVVSTATYFCGLFAEIEKLKKQVEEVTGQRDWWRAKYVAEKCADELEGVDHDALTKLITDFIRSQSTNQKDVISDTPAVAEGCNADTGQT